MKAISKQLAIVSCLLWPLVLLPSCMGQAQGDNKDYVPNEMQVADPEVKTYLDSADTEGKNGEYERAFLQLQKALDFCVKQNLHSDKALLEAKIATGYVVRGDIEHAKQYWLSADADSMAVGNLVLQADALIALSGIAKSYQKMDESLDLASGKERAGTRGALRNDRRSDYENATRFPREVSQTAKASSDFRDSRTPHRQ